MKFLICLLVSFLLAYACENGEIELVVKKEYLSYPTEEQYEIWRGTPETGVKLLEHNGTAADASTVVTNTICSTSTTHTVVMRDTYGDGWGTYSSAPYLTVSLGGITLIRTTMEYKSGRTFLRKEVPFEVSFSLPFSQSWKYTDTLQSTNDWKSPSYNDASWSTSNAGSMPLFTSVVRYYRLTTTIASRAAISTINYVVNTDQAFAIYIQGSEVYRYKMPDGNITSSTLPSDVPDGVAYYKGFTIYKYLLPESGPYVISLEIHLPQESTGISDLFNMGGATLGSATMDECTETRLIDGFSTEVPVNDNTYYTNAAFDGKTSSYYRSITTDHVTLTYMFPSSHAEYLNAYAIWSASTNYYGFPKSWNFYGTVDGTTWTLLDTRNNIDFGGITKRLFFPIRSNTLTLRGIRLEVLSSTQTSQVTVCEIEAMVCNYAYVAPGISYDQSTVSGYAEIDSFVLSPATFGYTSFSSTPTLPSGVILDTTSGTISGTPLVTVNQIYTIHALSISSSQEFTTTITINYNLCLPPQNLYIRLRKINKNYANEESFTLEDSNHTLLFTSPAFVNYKDWSTVLCVPSTILTVSASDSKNDGWTSDAFLYVDYNDYNGDFSTVGRIYYKKGTSGMYPINGMYSIYPQASDWKYTQGIIPTNWYATNEPTGFSIFPMASLPTPTSPIWLFRHSFSVATKTGYSAFDIRILSRAGILVYLNGQEIFRRNLNSGDITSTTTPIAGDLTTSSYLITSPLDVLLIGNNVIAIAIVNMASNNPDKMYFDASILLLTPNELGRNWDLSASDEPSSNTAVYLLDGAYYNTWINKPTDTRQISVILSYGIHRAEFINKYCFTSSNSQASGFDPSDWAVYGSNDNRVTTTLLGNVTNAYFSSRKQERCFYLPLNNKPYSSYIFYMTEPAVSSSANYGFALSEITLYSEDISQLVVPPLSYPITSFESYVGIPFTEITPSSSLWGNFRITPALILPLELDTSTGSIRGTPLSTMNPTAYTITASDPTGKESTVTITLSVSICVSPNIMFTLMIHATTFGKELGYSLKDSTGSLVSQQNGFSDNQDSYFAFCKPIGVYSLTLEDSASDGWDEGYAQIQLEDNTVIFRGSLGEAEESNTFLISAGYVIPPLRTEWKYYNSGSIPSNGWNTISFVETNWKASAAHSYEPANGITQYFRKTFTIDSITPYASAVFNLYTKYGLIVYLNGEEVYRYNLPNGLINYSTSCTAVSSSIQLVGSSVSISFGPLVQGQNVLAVEVHRDTISPDTIIDFDASLLLVADKSWRALDGTASADIGTQEEASIAFDNTAGSYYSTGPRCEGATLTWTYNNNRKEYISSYTIATGPKCNARHPSAWEIQGSNDGINWSTLDIRTKEMWTEYSQKRDYDFYTNRAYNAYRFIATECKNTAIDGSYMETEENCDTFNGKQGFQIGEIGLYVKKIEGACNPTEDGFSGALEGSYAFKDCPEFYKGRIQSLCTNGKLGEELKSCNLIAPSNIRYPQRVVNAIQGDYFENTPIVYAAEYECIINPELPHGVSFNTKTGSIYGKTESVFPSMGYTVNCSNIAGTYSTEVFLISAEKPSLPIYIWIIIAVLAIIIIAIVLFCVLCRLKSKKNKGHTKLEKKPNTQMKGAKPTTSTQSKTVKI
ncbi:hypothetical protein WA158_003596 [Blastocystis sp. Blastoise]